MPAETRRPRFGRRSGAVLALVCVAAVAPGCGGDDGSSGTTTTTPSVPTGGEETAMPATGTPAAGAGLTATVRLDRSRVLFDYALTNTGDEPLAVVDPAGVVDVLEPAGGEDAYRASFLRGSGDPAGGSPLPPLRGVIVAPGAEWTGTAGITGQFDRLPRTVQLCIEVVPQPWTDAGGGVAEVPYRPTGTDPLLVCTGQLAVPGAD